MLAAKTWSARPAGGGMMLMPCLTHSFLSPPPLMKNYAHLNHGISLDCHIYQGAPEVLIYRFPGEYKAYGYHRGIDCDIS